MAEIKNDIALVVSSCDKYEDAWYPYFELIKKYWPEHPKKIYLITETKTFECKDLDITVCNYDESFTWSERLYKTLEQIESKYIIFSLEDFFLLDYVKQDRIAECLDWMEEDSRIVECRLFSSDHPNLKKTEQYKDFYVADNTVNFRVDTQAALWRRDFLMSIIDTTEDPWRFEGNATERAKDYDKIFLWHKSDDLYSMEDKIFPYRMRAWHGYGIAWGHWLWENKKWFKQNGIENVKYRLGTLSSRTVNLRMKYLYSKTPPRFMKIIKPFWRLIIRVRKVKANIAIYGFKKGFKSSLKQM